MGTKNSYTGAGGAVGNDIRDNLDDWLDSLPGAPVATDLPIQDTSRPPGTSGVGPSSSQARVLPAVALFKASSGGGNSSRSRTTQTGGLTRSAAVSARSAGRGAAAAYAYRTGDAQTLRELGLDYDELRSNPNIFDVAHKIAQKVCEDLPAGTIETDEQLQVVGNLAEWLMETEAAGSNVSLSEIAEEAVALILAEAYLVETASKLNHKEMTGTDRVSFEDGVRQACEELAALSNLSPAGPTPAEFTTAIENGLEYLRSVYEGS